ncbi:MAG: endonuclease/exonuclease/phosphatase family protein [Algoriphagus sp.]|uniref:endonuclease/exonuclease/phosphatase family protein n=1 Tax=Algoriphagus sp. TaxID=1872435 RepID=UPI001800E4CF|nr:endonuclease/exonuclease/phosphatase family protein [Algoriphagus sp.]NVJ86315.1 endonuclease/exonuclease/phosphatase family protein [Algoriphagus sp.]
MKNLTNRLSLAFSLFFLVAINATISAQNHQVATFNIRWDNPNDEGNLWKDRLPHVVGLIEFHKIGLFGIQEGLHHQVTQLQDALGYQYLGVGRDDGDEKGEYTAVFFDPKEFKVHEEGTFWLSPTPEKPSKGWDAALNRICSWGKFEDSDGNQFYVFNIHYDHIGQQAREESSKLVVQKIEEINTQSLPVILLGDFNVTPDNPAYTTIIQSSGWKDTRLISKNPSYGPRGTFTGFDWEVLPDGIIDHIFINGDAQVLRHGILSDNYGKKYPSDHFPVMVEVKF